MRPKVLWSLKWGKDAPDNPWNAIGLEWMIQSPPISHNFPEIPVVTWEAYEYHKEEHHGHGAAPLPRAAEESRA